MLENNCTHRGPQLAVFRLYIGVVNHENLGEGEEPRVREM